MTTTSMAPGPAAGAATEPEATPGRSLPALIAAAGLVVVAVALVLMFGVARPPALSSLADQPEPAPSASVAWSAWDGDSACIHVARPDGGTSKVTCDQDAGEVLAWDDDGIAVWSWGPSDAVRWIDPATGEEQRRERMDDERIFDRWGSGVIRSRTSDGVLTVTNDETGGVLWAVQAPESYRVHEGSISPDGAWIAMFDSAERLLVVPADGSTEPRVWTDDGTSWEGLIWEGTPLERRDP
jgi:hypothetical protein